MVDIIKASGERQAYSKNKLCRSLLRAGVSKDIVNDVCSVVQKEIRANMTTDELFSRTAWHLRKQSPASAAKYSLKKAMMELGPQGFLFEQYVEAIFLEYGYCAKKKSAASLNEVRPYLFSTFLKNVFFSPWVKSPF